MRLMMLLLAGAAWLGAQDASAPDDVASRLKRATASMQLYIPGSDLPENLQIGERAEQEFRKVLELDPNNLPALGSLGTLKLGRKQWDDAAEFYRRIVSINPKDKTAYYTLALITWSRWYPVYSGARKQAGLPPEAPGPLPDPAVRMKLRSLWWSAIDDAIWNLQRALELDPQFEDAMAYLNLLIRERGDLRDTATEYQQDIAAADEWVEKALVAKRRSSSQGRLARLTPAVPGVPGSPPQRIRVATPVQQSLLVRKIDPDYPPLAARVQLQGRVILRAVIAKDGTVQELEVESGDPLLVSPAIEAVKQWLYKPTLLNGEPVEVATVIEVPFRLSQ
jgi:TonB family protein